MMARVRRRIMSSRGVSWRYSGLVAGDPTEVLVVYSQLFVWWPSSRTWIDCTPSGALPSGRVGHALVFDEGVGKVILFGGLGSRTHESRGAESHATVMTTFPFLCPWST